MCGIDCAVSKTGRLDWERREWVRFLLCVCIAYRLLCPLTLWNRTWSSDCYEWRLKTLPYCAYYKVLYCITVNGSIPWHSYRVSLAIWDHTVLPATPHKWTHPALTPAMPAGTRFTYPGGMEGWVDLVDLIAPLPGVEPATFGPRVQRSANATTKTATARQCALPSNSRTYSLVTNQIKIWVGYILYPIGVLNTGIDPFPYIASYLWQTKCRLFFIILHISSLCCYTLCGVSS